ncbi:unnamed protein product [Lepeophtheirus salmonis]|uniref:(salmon louse) hypothetical protein n=1 Tax=Lepeophtheirus salmonis TaxID=72036 RepID=A0A7R8CND8_LEPSM|nr:unnamed protein product [Lepeophtheirus salmonis]CAF2841120.1 unnamed protein product [Lepeophtheirus salmonis]
MSVRDISEDAFDLILEENSDSEVEGEDGWRRVACNAKSSYAWKIQVYTGKLADAHPEKKNQGMCGVLDLTEGLRGHNLTCDNFFTSYQLGHQLLKRKITKVGTVRKNKPELPPKDYWPLANFHNIIDVSSYNAFVIWREINPTWMSHKSHKRRVFLEQLGKALVAPLIERREKRPPNKGLSSDCESFSGCWTSGST